MVLHHVAQRAGAFVITGATFDSERFRGGDLDMIDVMRVPERREDRVREAKHQNVLRRFLAEKMIDPVGLLFGEGIVDDAIQFARRLQVSAERFLDDHARPASFAGLVQTGGLEMFQNRFELVRRDREIEKAIAARAAFLVDLIQLCARLLYPDSSSKSL